MQYRHLIHSFLTIASCAILFAMVTPANAEERGAQAVMNELEGVLITCELWPGFNPLDIPVAIYDGQDTYLFSHPAPPEGFEPVDGQATVSRFTGRHSAMVANTATMLNDEITASFMFSGDNYKTTLDQAAVVAHETFHVFQHFNHEGWRPNEAALFTFPNTNAAVLTARQLEYIALLEAYHAGDNTERLAWIAQAFNQRSEWVKHVNEAELEYVNELERLEGSASYIQMVVENPVHPEPSDIGSIVFTPETIRKQTYFIGALQALLLDQLNPDWKQDIENNDDTPYFFELLLATLPESTIPKDFSTEQLEVANTSISTALTDYANKLDEQRESFDEMEGWRVIVVADNAVLSPCGFDPMNVLNLGDGLLLHRRFIRLGSDAGVLEVMNTQTMTTAAGEHPLFNGIKRAVVHGLPEEPALVEENGRLIFSCTDFSLNCVGTYEKTGEREITVALQLPEEEPAE